MTTSNIPLVLKPKDLLSLPAGTQLTTIDVSSGEQYIESHIPGAVHMDYKRLVRTEGKAGGLLPTAADFATLLSDSGITKDDHVLAYDQSGGGAASRLIWTMHAFGLNNCSLLSGGLKAWLASGQVASSDASQAQAAELMQLSTDRHNVINSDELMSELNNKVPLSILDARSEKEYLGTDVRSARGGHVPGAVHFEWTKALDKERNLELLPDESLLELTRAHGFEPQQKVVAYCQTHQRSSLSYVMLKHLGFDNVLGLEGAWSEWGNRDDTPIETT